MTAAEALPLTALTIPIAHLIESPFNPRKHYAEGPLAELQASIQEHGILQPILVRPLAKERYEIVAGHRRTRAATAAGLTDIPATVRELSDADARKLQLVENAQRENLSPTDEADAYAALADVGMSVREIAVAVGKKPGEIAVRLTFVHLATAVKSALASGVLSVDHAELLTRIPDPTLQEQALARIIIHDEVGAKDVPLARSLAFTKRLIETEFLTALSAAPFDPNDVTLSPLGACATCPYRSGNNRDLFGDIRGKNVCTNVADFRLKITNLLTRMRDEGATVLLSPAEVRQAFPYVNAHLSERYIDLDAVCAEDPKKRTYDALLAAEPKRQTVHVYFAGRMWRLFPRELLITALRASGHAFVDRRPTPVPPDPAARAVRERQRIERGIRTAIATEFATKAATAKVTQSEFLDLLAAAIIEERSWMLDDVLLRHGYTGTRAALQPQRLKVAHHLVSKMSDAEKRAFLLDAIVSAWNSPQTSDRKRSVHRRAMTVMGVDVRAIEKRVRTANAAKRAQ